MPTYALLGATGSTGSAILRCLLSQPPKDLTLNIFVRSKSKLLKAFPNLETTTAFKTNIIEGTPSGSTATQECLKDVDVIMACIGSNYSTYGMTLIYDTAVAIVDALQVHQKRPGYKTPTIIQLRSIALNKENTAVPWIGKVVAGLCLRYLYEDLDRACKYYATSEASSPSLLEYILIDPPAIHDAEGTTPTGYRLGSDGPQEGFVSYADLGASFCEVAERRDEYFGQAVCVTGTGHVNLTMWPLLCFLASGAKGRVWG